MNMSWLKLVLGFTTAPIIPTVVGAQVVAGPRAWSLDVAIAGAIVGSIYTYPCTLVLGSAIHAALFNLRLRGLTAYVAVSTVVGAAATPALLHGGGTIEDAWFLAALGAGLGGSISSLFWLVRRPDLQRRA